MGTALFTGVTGLQVHQRRLDVVANNISNVNTVGYRGSRILFQDLFSQTLRGSSAPLGTFGGTNALQVGLGVQIASIDTNFNQGSLLTTGVTSDMAIQGSGFFILSDGVKQSYTRDGSFTLNANGLLIDPATGQRVQGFLADSNGNIDTNQLTDIFVPVGESNVRATTEATLTGNLNADARAGVPQDQVSRTISVFDSLGTERRIQIRFEKTANPNEWELDVFLDNGSGDPLTFPQLATNLQLQFDSNGRVQSGGTQPITITAADIGAAGTLPDLPFTFDLDFNDVTQLARGVDATTGVPLPSDVTLRNQDGFPPGDLQSFNIGANGQINGVFSNGLTRTLAQVALASFSNVGGLSRDGFNRFLETPASGNAQIGPPDSGGRGFISGGVLENSNVDLGEEFTSLIITQRGFQANARTITAADTLLQEAVNLIR